MLIAERNSRCCDFINETNVATGGRIVLGEPSSPVSTIIHIFPAYRFFTGRSGAGKKRAPGGRYVIGVHQSGKGRRCIDRQSEGVGSELYYR